MKTLKGIAVGVVEFVKIVVCVGILIRRMCKNPPEIPSHPICLS